MRTIESTNSRKLPDHVHIIAVDILQEYKDKFFPLDGRRDFDKFRTHMQAKRKEFYDELEYRVRRMEAGTVLESWRFQ